MQGCSAHFSSFSVRVFLSLLLLLVYDCYDLVAAEMPKVETAIMANRLIHLAPESNISNSLTIFMPSQMHCFCSGIGLKINYHGPFHQNNDTSNNNNNTSNKQQQRKLKEKKK